MMKILLIGYYDYSYYAGACVLENNEIKDIELTEGELEIIYNDREDNPDSEEYQKIEKEIFSQYDLVILCENGGFELLKGTNQEHLKTNKDLQTLKELIENLKGKDNALSLYDEERIKIIKTTLEDAEMYKRAIEIIKKKSIEIHPFMFGVTINTYEAFIEGGTKYGWFAKEPTRQEYELLKKVLL